MSFFVKNISYTFDGKDAPTLDQISFEIKEGEVACVVGKSGCGKSTLASVLSGVIPELVQNGTLCGEFSFGDKLIGVVSQSPENQLFGYSVEDALVFGLENMGTSAQEMDQRLEYVLELLSIEHLRNRSIATLSGGQRQAVCIASVLAMNPDILIMDEPVSSLDPSGKQMVAKLLGQLKAGGQTTLIIDNNLDWCGNLVEHIIGIDQGKVVFDGSTAQFFENEDLCLDLGVYIPGEVQICAELKKVLPDISTFSTYQQALQVLQAKLASAPRSSSPLAQQLPEPIVEVQQLNKTFADGFHALMDIEVGFPKGSITGILGQNGSGKTTLVRHINGLIKPTSGRVLFLGEDTAKKSVAQISKDMILVFQHPEHMLFEETVYKELVFCANAQKVPYSEEEAKQVLKTFGFEHLAEEFPINLPMGQKHILTILSVLFSSAQVIILDEPTLGLDYALKEQLKQILQVLAQKGKTVIMISHEIPLVFETCDYLYLLNNGKSMYFGTRDQMADNIDLLEQVKILVPPVIKLAQHFGFGADVVTAKDFALEFAKRVKQEVQ